MPATIDGVLSKRLYSWQNDVIKDIRSGKCRYLFAPRQNGKSQIFVNLCLDYALVEMRNILYTAHTQKSARKFFVKIRDEIQANTQIEQYVELIVNGVGHEHIAFRGGGTISFGTRTETTAVGDTNDVVIFDEAQFLSNSHLSAILPTVVAIKDSKVLYTGTPPYNNALCDMILSDRKIFRGTPVWREWSLNNVIDKEDLTINLMEEKQLEYLIKQPNPSHEHMNIDQIKLNLRSMGDEKFRREHLGEWLDYRDPSALTSHDVERATYDDDFDFTYCAAGVKIGKNDNAGFAIAQKKGDTLFCMAIGEYDGVYDLDSIANTINDKKTIRRIISDGNASTRLSKLCKKQVKFANSGDYMAACDNFYSGILSGKIKVANQPEIKAPLVMWSKKDTGRQGFRIAAISDDQNIEIVEAMALASYYADVAHGGTKII